MPLYFAYIVDLLEDLEAISRRSLWTTTQKHDESVVRIQRWFHDHDSAINESSQHCAALLSTLIPERRTDRVYGLRIPRLKKMLGRALRMGTARVQLLSSWTDASPENFPELVARLHAATEAGLPSCRLLVTDVDRILQELAFKCAFSSPQIRATAGQRAPDEIVGSLCPLLTARELKTVVRLILKNFSPVTLDENLIL